jgi:hypothetical protein
MMYGVWCKVYGAWCMVYGVWCIVYGVQGTLVIKELAIQDPASAAP